MCPGAFTICFILFRATKSIAPMVQIEKRTSWRAVLCLILGPSFFLSVLFFASMPSDTPLPYREFRRIISVAPFVGVLLGHIAWRQIRSSEGRIGGFRLAISSFCSLKPPLPPRPIAKFRTPDMVGREPVRFLVQNRGVRPHNASGAECLGRAFLFC